MNANPLNGGSEPVARFRALRTAPMHRQARHQDNARCSPVSCALGAASKHLGVVEGDLEDSALLLPVLARKRPRLLEFLEQYLHDALEFALLGWRKMIEVGAHEMFVP